VIHLVHCAGTVDGHLQGNPDALRFPVATLYPLVHAVQNRPGKVGLRVRQSVRVVGAGSFAQGEIAFALQVVTQVATLPRWPVLQEVSSKSFDEPLVFNDQVLFWLGELRFASHG